MCSWCCCCFWENLQYRHSTTLRGHYINSHQPLPGFSDVRSLFFWKTYCEELKCKMASEWHRLKRHWIYITPRFDNAQGFKACINNRFLPARGFNQLNDEPRKSTVEKPLAEQVAHQKLEHLSEEWWRGIEECEADILRWMFILQIMPWSFALLIHFLNLFREPKWFFWNMVAQLYMLACLPCRSCRG